MTDPLLSLGTCPVIMTPTTTVAPRSPTYRHRPQRGRHCISKEEKVSPSPNPHQYCGMQRQSNAWGYADAQAGVKAVQCIEGQNIWVRFLALAAACWRGLGESLPCSAPALISCGDWKLFGAEAACTLAAASGCYYHIREMTESKTQPGYPELPRANGTETSPPAKMFLPSLFPGWPVCTAGSSSPAQLGQLVPPPLPPEEGSEPSLPYICSTSYLFVSITSQVVGGRTLMPGPSPTSRTPYDLMGMR